jgi:hypothetical protein
MHHQVSIFLYSDLSIQTLLGELQKQSLSQKIRDLALLAVTIDTLDESRKLVVKSMPGHGCLFVGGSPLDHIGREIDFPHDHLRAMYFDPTQVTHAHERISSVLKTMGNLAETLGAEESLIVNTLKIAVRERHHVLVFSDFKFRGYE